MDTEYDHKFEEMKKYIPFLENMITRLESTNTSSSNPRQAQLDKIRSLRDLLSNKKKRMKMENLLKCEQVLINLYAKVEQRDTLSGVKKTSDSGFSIDTPTAKEKSDLEAVRNKLKTVAKRQENSQETLPEILPRSEVNDVHTSGTKEPALFQRRPNQKNNETDDSRTSPQSSASKRNYTRVLVSPESRRWSPTKTSAEKPLFSRRSPRKSPRRYSPSYHKKERKKSKDSQKRKDLNITLNVPEESLNSLNTKDILSRIINCSDGDVDIDTLRELRKQILGELQKTGAKDDISDLILKSYNKNKKDKHKLKEEVEEGELSDSESEAIESIYGSLVVKEPGQTKVSSDKDTQPRKIQICLVINSDDKPKELPNQDITTELEMYETENKDKIKSYPVNEQNKPDDSEPSTEKAKADNNSYLESQKVSKNDTINSNDNAVVDVQETEEIPAKVGKDESIASTKEDLVLPNKDETTPKESIQFKANFYKPLTEQCNSETVEPLKDNETCAQVESDGTKPLNKTKLSGIESTLEQMEKSPEIPLLHERTIEKKPPDTTLSEIDILQALKNEILSEITVPGTGTSTPLLHQPKVIKVASAQEILPKKRISIEKYKEKSISSTKSHSDHKPLKEDQMKKTSLKLTDKECERFFNIPRISFDDDDESLGADDDDILASDVYGDLAPKSPDHDEASTLGSAPPVIIPVDPVKTMPVTQKADVDMRTLPILSPSSTKAPLAYNTIGSHPNNDLAMDKMKIDNRVDQSDTLIRPSLIDPRVRRDHNPNITNLSPNPHAGLSDRLPRHLFTGISTNPASNPVITTNARTYEMTPTHQSFEIDQSSRKHVYVPTIASLDYREREKSVAKDPTVERRSRIDDARETCWNPQRDNLSQNSRYNESCNTVPTNDRYQTPVTSNQSYANQCQGPITPLQSFGRLDCPSTPSHPFGRLECPSTPSHPFGRLECPPTPSHPFGRSDCPPTPSHPFGRMDCPTTPNHPFGRLDCPPTPSHPFGRSDCPATPNHPFGRSEGPPPLMRNLIECPTTPTPMFGRNECPPNSNHSFSKSECLPSQNHKFPLLETPQISGGSFGRSDPTKNQYSRSDFNTQKYTKDPRLHRKPDSESHYDDRDRGYYKDRDRYRGAFSSQKSYHDRNYDREQTVGRSRYKYYSPDLSSRLYNKDKDKNDRSLDSYTSKDIERRFNADKGENSRTPARASSVTKKSFNEPERNTLSVKSNAGRSFTIDTSINTTFQKIKGSSSTNNFDARRQRAASVGRFLTRELSVGRTLSPVSKPTSILYENKREAFRRAASVGRDIFDSNTDKRSFQEIKAEFKSCKFSDKDFSKNRSESRYINKSKETPEHSARSRKDIYEREKYEKRGHESSKSYSPRKNYRDPRMRRQFENKSDRYSYDAQSRKSGIVYSNDNIVKGSILRPGYGVKNYKIPKIKRPMEEKEEKSVENIEIDSKNDHKEIDKKAMDNKIKEKDTTNEKVYGKAQYELKDNIKQKAKELDDTTTEINDALGDDAVKSDESVERRWTRATTKSMRESKANTESLVKSKKYKKVIYDSDSESETNIKDHNIDTKNKTESMNDTSMTQLSPVKEKTKSKKLDPADLDSSYGIDELEMFSDNIVSDPVIDDNINALIADLDSDLNTSKNDVGHNFTKEFSLENMMQNISSPSKDDLTQNRENSDKLTNVVSKDNVKAPIISKNNENEAHETAPINILDLPKSNESNIDVDLKDAKSDMNTNDNKNGTHLKETIGNTPTQSDIVHSEEKVRNALLSSEAKTISDDIDSTTENEKDIKCTEDKLTSNEQNMDGCSTPDSTINTEEVLQKTPNEESLPGTNEVTSTESIEPKPTSSAKDLTPALESIGSLLSILQDKSKIKELLNMLDSQSSDNEKIKKKLEKLSEIVSDDEETADISTAKVDQSQKDKIESPDTDMNTKTLDSKQICNEKEANLLEDEQLNKDSSSFHTDSKPDDDDTKSSDIGDMQQTDTELPNDEVKPKKKPVKKTKCVKKGKAKLKKVKSTVVKRVTRATAAEKKPKSKKPPRELMQLQEDIKEMFIRDEVLSATGIRMCRLAKLVDEKTSPTKEEPVVPDVGPVVVLQKFKETNDKITEFEKSKKKKIKLKSKEIIKRDKSSADIKLKPGPKSKTKNKKEDDPYAFELDSVGDTNTEKASDDGLSSNYDSESESIASSKSFGSTELLADIKKKTKRKRRGWQAGVIKTKTKKKKLDPKPTESSPTNFDDLLPEKAPSPDLGCFTDRNYCFRKNQLTYSCRLCTFSGTDIVLHYRNQHPYTEIPLSRMSPEVAKEAIEQCGEINFKAISKIPSDKYVCTFCYKEFINNKSVLETFFWHIVSMHTGEYKHNCTRCDNQNNCPFDLAIPPPPKDIQGQLIGFICKKCNFTQISLENLKTHVIMRHNDEQTAVYTINLSVMSRKSLNALLRRGEVEEPSLPISKDTDEKNNENDGVKTRTSMRKVNSPPIQSKITFEGDDNTELYDEKTVTGEMKIKIERIDSENGDGTANNEDDSTTNISDIDKHKVAEKIVDSQHKSPEHQPSNDIVDYPHFKVNVNKSGAKEYYCCINGVYHFKTTLLISMKKHVQLKHSENWDGYCYVCKVIVTPQGEHRFRDCLQHYLEKHMDSFPVFQNEAECAPGDGELAGPSQSASKSYINVRPLSDLMTKADTAVTHETATLPIIQSVMSLGATSVEPPNPSPCPSPVQERQKFIYEDHQAAVVSKKYYLILQAMITPENLIKIFKCSGRYCVYSTDSVEDALAHATTHQRIGGTDALICSYCNFDAVENAVDLVTHVFKSHGFSQYCCKQCFYRAASSQAVIAHMTRVHGAAPVPSSVLHTKTVPSIPVPKPEMLTREQAVSHYACPHKELAGRCKFRTYTPDKFCEHLVQRHSTASTHPCDICSVDVATAADLVHHMKSHGYKLYQCTWCVHGADSEAEFLAHISSDHPDKQPQAYVRIITSKDGSSALRVLPLAVLNKYVPTKTIQSAATKENPVREAERSIEIESLLGSILTATAEPTETPAQTAEPPEQIPEKTIDTKPPKDIQIAETAATPRPEVVQSPKPTLNVTPVTALQGAHIPSVKTEPTETEKHVLPDVVVLDSDDEDSTPTTQQPIIDLSEDEPAQPIANNQVNSPENNSTSKMIPMSCLYTCPRCKQVCKNMGGLKKHIYCCAINTINIQCPHCACPAENLDKLVWHYVADHSQQNTFQCGLCDALLVTENLARKHFKTVHKESNIMATPTENVGGPRFIINARKKSTAETPKEKIPPKRKLSGPNADATPIKRRFEPQEINQLPINPILDHLVYCSRCEFSTKVRLNMVRHLQLHAEQQPVPQTAPVNPVPHLESNEKHFDKMVNLASSSIVNRTPDKTRPDYVPAVTLLIPPEAASRYPKYVPERQRHTCGAKGCSYISVDEAMLRCHWETLHSGTSDFHCVHCPPHQHLDTSKPLTATRIISHLKMHDATLYACSSCSYYHFKREALEKHLSEVHKGGRLMVVREEYSAPVSPSPVQTNVAPTMDLKPWQCGLCKFKSMLRPEVVDHCSKVHQSKMQFKCAYCPFRTSAVENVSKHQSNSHAGRPENIFYYYYREGSIPDDVDGTPRWMKQRQKMCATEPEVKVEVSISPIPEPVLPTPDASTLTVDLNLVKKEVDEVLSAPVEQTLEGLCKIFGQICDPNGIKFKCPLCSVVMEDTREGMQSHLYEELNYRKWSCGLCSYKAFHKAGLSDHMSAEHRRQYDHIELPTDFNIEKWVACVLNHQFVIIEKHKQNLAKQKISVEQNKPGPSTEAVAVKEPVALYTEKDLETAFGPFGLPNESTYCCPKCSFMCKDEGAMKDHLEIELNKIRWCCSNCPENFQTYHEAQFHCKSHDGSSRPVEAMRNPTMRAAWVSTTIQIQKKVIQNRAAPSCSEVTSTSEKNILESDNSLLVVRYEERVPTPEQVAVKRKRPGPVPIRESIDVKLVIDEPSPKKKPPEKKCPYCNYVSSYNNNVKLHMMTHFDLKPYTCGYCKFSSYKKTIVKHIQQMHVNKPIKVKMTELPPDARKIGEPEPPNPDAPKSICLVCEKAVPEAMIDSHLHNNIRPQFAKGDIVVKCCICLTLCLDVSALQVHHCLEHNGEPVNYALYKLGYDSRETYQCAYCNNRFKYIKDYKAHHNAVHPEMSFNIATASFTPPGLDGVGIKDAASPVVLKRCARKSTTKLPNSVAKKSTTKLPYSVPSSSDNEMEEYSYYGTKSAPLQQYSNVTTLMSFCNKMMPFSLKQLSDLLNIEPKVMVTDIKHSSD